MASSRLTVTLYRHLLRECKRVDARPAVRALIEPHHETARWGLTAPEPEIWERFCHVSIDAPTTRSVVAETFRADHEDNNSMVDLALEALREMQQALEAADQIGFTEPHVELLDAAPQSSYDTYHSRRDPAVSKALKYIAIATLKRDAVRQKFLQKSIAEFPTADAWNRLAVHHRENGNQDESMRCLKEAIAVDADYGDAHNELGCLLLIQNSDQEAIESFKRAKATSRLTARHTPSMNLGAVYHSQQEYFDAMFHYLESLHILQRTPEFRKDLVVLQQVITALAKKIIPDINLAIEANNKN